MIEGLIPGHFKQRIAGLILMSTFYMRHFHEKFEPTEKKISRPFSIDKKLFLKFEKYFT